VAANLQTADYIELADAQIELLPWLSVGERNERERELEKAKSAESVLTDPFAASRIINVDEHVLFRMSG
jgi:hypothetical protein